MLIRSTTRYADLEKPKKKKTLSSTSLVSIPNTIKLSMLNSGLLSLDKVKLSARDEKNPLSQTMPDKPTELRHFAKLCEQRRKFPILYKLEFQTAVKVETNSCKHALRKANALKNQNPKCIPYDYNRVVLDKYDNTPDSDYINASYVDSLLKPNAYIVTQGPTEDTVLDFWRMVWQENCSAIVMLTKTFDFTKVMCVQYWPPNKEKEEIYGDMHITIQSEEELANFHIRTFRLFKLNKDNVVSEERFLLQFHYTEWHSHTCPFSNAILEFRRRVRAVVGTIIKANSRIGPMLVHCNDGGGRSGVYLAIDANMELAEEEDSFHVFGYLKKLRQSRKGLIENVDQYKFVYDTLEEFIICGNSWFPVKELSQRLKEKSLKDPLTKMNSYQREYAQICKQTPRFTIGDCAGGHRGDNREKNRDVLCVPPDNFRPYLSSFQGNSFTDYINAVFVDGYTKPREYIVTEWPLQKTCGEFWSLVYDHECSAVVVLCQPPHNSQQYPAFWPEGRHSKKYGPVFTIDHISHQHYSNIKSWVFRINKKVISLTELMAGVKAPPRTVQLFQLTCWPMGHKVPTSTNSLVELMNMVERWRQKTDYGPVCVVSPDGRSRAGVYCAANACIEQVIQHGEVDVFQAVKTVRRHRPQLVDNMTEYKYCYDLVLHYVLHYLNKDLKEKKFIEFGRGKSIPLTPEYSNSELSKELSNAGRVIVEKNIRKLQKGESYDHCQSFDDKKFVIDKNGRICERKKKGRLYSLGGNDPPKRCTRGRLDRLKTVGTFDITNEISRLSQKTMNLNERIISTQLFAQTIDETATTTTSVGSSVGLSVGFAPFVAAATAGLAGPSGTTVMLPTDAAPGPSPSSASLAAKQSAETIHLSSPHHLHPQHTGTLGQQASPPAAEHSTPPSTTRTTGKSRSLSTGSYITKDSSAHSSAERLTKSNSHTEVHANSGPTAGTSKDPSGAGVMPQNRSLEEGRSMIPSVKSSPPVRKPILRKSKKIVRTDSEFLKGNIYEKESSVSSSQYTPTRERRREQFADYRSSNPSSETHKSTDESSKNISTDEIDTVFSDTMDLEQMEQDYRMHLKNNLQREYKSDSDTLDEVGKKRVPDYNAWKNQSYENTFDVYGKEATEQTANGKHHTGETDRAVADTASKADELSVHSSAAPVTASSSGPSKPDRPTDLELGSTSDGGCKSSASSTNDGPFGHLFEKNLGRFKRMNKLLKCKRFSTSALYEKKTSTGGSTSASAASDGKPSFTSPTKSIPNAARSPVKSIHSQSKASISSSKSSLFGSKKSGTGFTFKGKRFLFTGKTSPNKSKSNNEISYYRTKSTKGSKKGSLKNNSTACLNLETTCTSPLSEAFYNTTGSVRLSAMELYEKFCSQDFSGLYKHETVRTDTDSHGSGTDSSHYESHRHLGAIRKYRRRNFKLLRQKSEPKFSFRTDTLYEDSYDGVCYHDEKDEEEEYGAEEYNQFLYDEQYYEEDIEHYSIENIYYQRNGLMALPDGTYVQRYPYRMEDEEGDQDEEGEEEDDEEEEECEEEEEELGEEEECEYQGEEEEDEEEDDVVDENEFDEEDEDELALEEEEEERRRVQRLQLAPPPLPPHELVASMDSDCDEIYLMPQNESESKKLIIQDFLFHRSNNDFETGAPGDDYDIAEVDEDAEEVVESDPPEVPEDQDFRLERYAATDKETLTIYKICSKESILESMRGETPDRTSDTIPHSASMEQYFLQSDCVTTLERTASLDLLSNSSGTLNKSTLTDYAFDTVRNVNLDSCSTSRLSLSLKSEIFEDSTNGGGSGGAGGSGGGGPSTSGEPITPGTLENSAAGSVDTTPEARGSDVPRIKSWNIEDFTLTPEESFSDEQLPLDGPTGNGDTVKLAELLQERCAESCPGQERLEHDHSNGTAEYTIVDLDEEPYLLDPTISEFTSEITKEFDLLFSRAETESLQAATAAAAAVVAVEPSVPDGPSQLGDVLKLLSDLPTRYSMQMLEHINLDTDEISIPIRGDEDVKKDPSPTASAVVVAPLSQSPPATTVPANPSEPAAKSSVPTSHPPESAKPRTLEPSGSGRSSTKMKLRSTRSAGLAKTAATTPTAADIVVVADGVQDAATAGGSVTTSSSSTSNDRLKKARSQSLGNLRNKTKCFPL
uniref:Protein-tyrosine-phosphatase n=1 Tax=Anopheles farauti TaxID=69004 RepID=A0A182QTG8_9DIPT